MLGETATCRKLANTFAVTSIFEKLARVAVDFNLIFGAFYPFGRKFC